MRLVPAIDLIGGKCVRLTKGDYATKKIYGENPVEVAKKFEDAGLKHLHLVDLDGAKSRHIVNHKILEKITLHTSLQVDFGGGIKTDEDLRTAFECGATQITAGSIAVQNPEMLVDWLEKYGSEKIILGADALNRKISIQGWKENSSLDVIEFIARHEKTGVKYVICTDIDRDGALQGPAVELYEEILAKTSVKLIASGGISCIDDLRKLKKTGCEAAIIGKAIYEEKISLSSIMNYDL